MERPLSHIKDLARALGWFLRDPLAAMKNPSRLSWPAILSLQIGVAMVSGALVGMMQRNFWNFLAGILIFPLTSLTAGFVFSLFVYYYFSVFRSTFLDFRRLHAMMVFALIPYFVLHTVAGLLGAIDLVGFMASAALMFVGLVEQFGLDKRIVRRLIGVLTAAFVTIWITVTIGTHQKEEVTQKTLLPKSLDDLEKEVSPQNGN